MPRAAAMRQRCFSLCRCFFRHTMPLLFRCYAMPVSLYATTPTSRPPTPALSPFRYTLRLPRRRFHAAALRPRLITFFAFSFAMPPFRAQQRSADTPIAPLLLLLIFFHRRRRRERARQPRTMLMLAAQRYTRGLRVRVCARLRAMPSALMIAITPAASAADASATAAPLPPLMLSLPLSPLRYAPLMLMPRCR